MAKARCPKYRHYVLCGECLVDLDQVHVLDSQVGASQGHLEGGDGAEAAGARLVNRVSTMHHTYYERARQAYPMIVGSTPALQQPKHVHRHHV